MRSARRLVMLWTALLAVTSAAPALADNYNETTKFWFLDTTTPNWLCDDTSAACYPSSPNAASFNGLYLVRRNGILYAYVQGGGNPGPCAPLNGGDNFCVFTAPDTASGWTGQGVRLANHRPRPDDGAFWQVRTAFYDANFGRFYVIASRTATGTTATIDTMEARLGTSTDGIHFTWTTLMTSQRSQIALRLEDYVLAPHPTQPRVWVGTISGVTAQEQPYITPWQVDWNTSTIRVATSATAWQEVPIGGTLTAAPYIKWYGRVTSLQPVTAGGASRFEAWGTTPALGTGNLTTDNPCVPGYPNGTPTCQYRINTDRAGTCSGTNRFPGQQVGRSAVQFWVFDPNQVLSPDPNQPLQPPVQITSSVRALPSDYAMALGWMAFRFAPGGRDYVYTGSKDNVICSYPLTYNPWAGQGILVTKIGYTP